MKQIIVTVGREHGSGGKVPPEWRALFTERGWSVPVFERVELDLGGAFEDVWAFLGASYQLPVDHAPAVRAELHAALGDRVDCRVAAYLAAVRR